MGVDLCIIDVKFSQYCLFLLFSRRRNEAKIPSGAINTHPHNIVCFCPIQNNAQYKTNKSAIGRRYINEDVEKNIINENNKSAIGRRYTNEDAEKNMSNENNKSAVGRRYINEDAEKT